MAKAESASEDKPEGLRLRARLRYLYHGSTPAAVKFRLAIIVIDLFIIGFFLAGPILKNAGWVFYVADYAIAAFLAIDLIARAMAYTDARDWLKRPVVWADLFVLATFLFPAWLDNFGFLRMIRLWTLVNSEIFWRTIGRRFDDTRVEEITKALAALVTSVDAREAIILTRPHVVAEFFHVDWTSRARRKLGVPVLHLIEHESFDEQAGSGEGVSGL